MKFYQKKIKILEEENARLKSQLEAGPAGPSGHVLDHASNTSRVNTFAENL